MNKLRTLKETSASSQYNQSWNLEYQWNLFRALHNLPKQSYYSSSHLSPLHNDSVKHSRLRDVNDYA